MTSIKRYQIEKFAISKPKLQRNFASNDRGPEHNDVRDLLQRRTRKYTIAEIKLLCGFLWTSHDECVDANPDEYNPLQVYQARYNIRHGQWIIEKVQEQEIKDIHEEQLHAATN